MGGDREELAGGDGDVSSLHRPACTRTGEGRRGGREDGLGMEGKSSGDGTAGFAERTRHQVSLYSHSENRKAGPGPPKDGRKLGALSPPGSARVLTSCCRAGTGSPHASDSPDVTGVRTAGGSLLPLALNPTIGGPGLWASNDFDLGDIRIQTRDPRLISPQGPGVTTGGIVCKRECVPSLKTFQFGD